MSQRQRLPVLFVLSGLALLLAPAARADDTAAVIARARAYLGSDAALDAVRSIHYTGTLKTDDHPAPLPVDIIFEKPYRQRTVVTSPKEVETTALDGYDAWQSVQDTTPDQRWKKVLFGPAEILKLRANTWENLNSFSGLEQAGGRVDNLGAAVVDGKTCDKLAFIHEDNVVFTRYFERATGRLLLTETNDGSRIREQGEILVNGVRFPKTVITTANGHTVTITFDKITLNETFAESLFAFPLAAPQL
jgi:hypothetical protein